MQKNIPIRLILKDVEVFQVRVPYPSAGVHILIIKVFSIPSHD